MLVLVPSLGYLFHQNLR